MHVLFISSSLPNGQPSPIIKNQAKALSNLGVEIEFYTLKHKGLKGYFKEIFLLKRFLKNHSYQIYHAHYGLSAIVATLAGAKPLIVSLMGSDVRKAGWLLLLIRYFLKTRWFKTIVKSKEMSAMVNKNKTVVIPNGVDLEVFKPIARYIARERLGLNEHKHYLLFAADTQRPEKNYRLVEEAYNQAKLQNCQLLTLGGIDNQEVPYYINASDVVLLSSIYEGSPNVIKEAMACSRPIVSTKVGDVEWLLEGVSGSFIADFSVEDYAQKIEYALEYANNNNQTNGRDMLIMKKLDSESVAKKIIRIYKKLIQ